MSPDPGSESGPADPEYGAPSDNTTVVAELERFRADGYDGDFLVEAGPALRCRTCDQVTPAADLELDALRRLEGASDPADMAAILALQCPSCGAKGTAMVHYGPGATEEDDALLLALPDRDRGRGTDQQTDT